MNKILLWIYWLIAAVIGGAASSITVAIVDPETFNLETGLKKLAIVACVSGLLAAANYLKQSPLPGAKK
jgi:nucleoside recognition membrane protein YjiH